MKYFVNSDGKNSVIALDSSKIQENEKTISPDFAEVSPHIYSLLNEGTSSDIYVKEHGSDYLVYVDGKRFEVKLEGEKERIIRRLIKTEEKQTGRIEIKAPMPGLITQFNVNKGDPVKKGDQVAIIEAMKMENEIRASSDGIVTEVFKEKGNSVEKDSVLLVVE